MMASTDCQRKPIQNGAEDQARFELQAVMDCLYDVLFITAPTGIALRASKSTARLTGVRAEDWVGRHFDWVERNVTLYPSVTRTALLERRAITAEQRTRTTGRRLLMSATPVKNEDGKIAAVVTIGRDVSELIDLRDQVVGGSILETPDNPDRVLPSIVAASRELYSVLEDVSKIASTDCTVLITGESGVGKELVARAIHERSPRRNRPFVKINCGSIPENLVESELFGYERGAFTGANREGKPGLFDVARGGTLFLDEIGELPQRTQPKLLEVLEDGWYLPVGGVRHRKADCRIVAATNADLECMVSSREFRADLYYRLAVFPLKIPPLRDRVADIEPLAHHFLESFNRKYGKNLTLSPELLSLLVKCPWPGNVRELRNAIERMVITADVDGAIPPSHLLASMRVAGDNGVLKGIQWQGPPKTTPRDRSMGCRAGVGRLEMRSE